MFVLINTILLYILFLFFKYLVLKPSNFRNWSEDQKKLPYIEIKGTEFYIYNIRNFDYKSESSFITKYYNKAYNIDDLLSVDYFLTIFKKNWDGPAHNFLSFGFKNGEHVAISIEIRKKEGDKFSALKGLFKKFELMYVVANEADLLNLRINIRKHDTYLFPLNLQNDKVKKLFIDIVRSINHLQINPEFYNTISNSCSTRLFMHLNNVLSKKIRMNHRILLPGYSYKVLQSNNLIKESSNREKYLINNNVLKYFKDKEFSKKIRNI